MLSPEARRSRIENRLPVAREGLPFILCGIALAVLSGFLGWNIALLIFAFLTIFVVYFFRDPERKPDEAGNAVLSPADGLVIKAGPLTDSDNPFEGPCREVCIFMSLFDVHVNRAMVSGVVTGIDYVEGSFVSADLDKASLQNERNRIRVKTPEDRTLVVVQIAGLIARRIACWVGVGDRITAGQRFGLIRFGSRLDVYLPEDSTITVTPGHRVKAGKSVIGYLN